MTKLEIKLHEALKNLVANSGHMQPFGGHGATVKSLRLAMKYMEAFEAAEVAIAEADVVAEKERAPVACIK